MTQLTATPDHLAAPFARLAGNGFGDSGDLLLETPAPEASFLRFADGGTR